jgi:hypothetical protein
MLLYGSAIDSLVAKDDVAEVEERNVSPLSPVLVVLTPIVAVATIAALGHVAVAATTTTTATAVVALASAVATPVPAPPADDLGQLLFAEDADGFVIHVVEVVHGVLVPSESFARRAAVLAGTIADGVPRAAERAGSQNSRLSVAAANVRDECRQSVEE